MIVGAVLLALSTTRAVVDSLSSALYALEREIKISRRPARRKEDPWSI